MRNLLRCQVLFWFVVGLCGCGSLVQSFYDDTPFVEEDAETELREKNHLVVADSAVMLEERNINLIKSVPSCCKGCSAASSSSVAMTLNGLKYCPPHKRCPDDGILPPQPCLQPMPEYYNNISPLESAEGVVLIHPYTRAEVICFDDYGQTAAQCADTFKAKGYVLITDLPQLPARYDFLKEGTYPTRRWRGGGEVVPRW